MKNSVKWLMQAVQDGLALASQIIGWTLQNLEVVACWSGGVVIVLAILVVLQSRRRAKRRRRVAQDRVID